MRTILAFLTALTMAAGAQAADLVVAASTAAGVSPGRILQGDAPLELAAGESVTLIGAAGPVEVSGPFSGTAGEAAGAADQPAATALLNRRARTRSLAASRGFSLTPSDTALHVMADSAWCVDGAPPALFFPSARTDRVVTLAPSAGEAVEILWPAAETVLPWPEAAPFEAGRRYAFKVGDVLLPGELELKPGVAGEGGDLVAGLIAAGCYGQAEAAIAEIRGD